MVTAAEQKQDTSVIAVVNLMKTCIKYYGGSCLPFKVINMSLCVLAYIVY